MSQRGDRPSCPLLFQQGAQLAPTGEPLGPLYVHRTHLTGHSELFFGVPACRTQNTQQVLWLILETTKEAVSLLESLLLYLLMRPPAGTVGTCKVSDIPPGLGEHLMSSEAEMRVGGT